ncbi:MAG: glyoxylate/hydroxypyruvate reductase A [Maribacter sp.]|nr:glyoxylate/hydroxypyruvate reductase A [Maribacter sp.]
MAIVIIRQDHKIDAWKTALKAADPNIPVFSYLEDHPVSQIDMALVWKHPQGTLNRYPNLKCIASSGAGVDFIFKDDYPKKIPITRIVDTMLANDMSEHVIAVIFSYLKNLGQYRLDQIRGIWKPIDYHRVSDYTIGILGVGALGAVLAKDLRNYGFQAQGWARSKKDIAGLPMYVGDGQLPSFLAGTQILVCLLPLTGKTTGILNKQLFGQLPQGAYIINVARGGHLIDTDLVEMIDSGHLSGACLDVYHEEPLPNTHPFWQHDKIHMTPHYASVSDTASVVPQIIENYHRLQKGRPLLHLVSPSKGY